MESAIGARASALGLSAEPDPEPESMEKIMLTTNFVFDEVSRVLLKEGDWKTGLAGRVVDDRNILELEGLAAVLGFRDLLRDNAAIG